MTDTNPNLNPEVLERFKANPDAFFQQDFSTWGVNTFNTYSGILEWLNKNRPNSPYIVRVVLQMLDYMKHCYDNDLDFPWEQSFPPADGKSSKENFLDYYRKNIGPIREMARR